MLGIAGFFFGLGSPQIFAIAQTLSGPRVGGQWMGIHGIIAPIVTGWTVEVTGQFYVAFLLTAMILMACRVSADHLRLRKWLFRDWLLSVFA